MQWQAGAAASGATRVVVAPLNLAIQLEPDLEPGVESVQAELIRYFRAHGAQVAIIWPPEARGLWHEVYLGLRLDPASPPQLESVAASFAQALTEHADFDWLVLPSLLYRKARARGDHAFWDGVRRRLSQAEARAAAGSSVDQPVFYEEIPAVSLHVLVLTPEGRLSYQGWGGIDLAHEAVRVGGGARPVTGFLRPREDALNEQDHVAEGVARALDPHVGALAR